MSHILEGRIDFEGQYLSQQVGEVTLAFGTAAAYIGGYAMSSVYHSILFFGATILLATVLSVPPWPMYNKHPVQFLPPLKGGKSE